MHLHPSLVCVLLLLGLILAACAAPSPSPSLVPTPTRTPTITPMPTPTHVRRITPTPTPTRRPTIVPSPTQVTSPIRTPVPDVVRMEVAPLRPFDYTVVNAEPPLRAPNATQNFWVIDGATGERREITARLRVQTDHVAMWVEEGEWHDVRLMEEAASFFETHIYSTTRAAFGSEWAPGVDNDPRVHILHAADLGADVMGYTSSADEFPRALYPFSNEAEMIVVHIDCVAVGSPAYYALLTRQFQRLIQWFQDRNEERWVKEGMAELAAWIALNSVEAAGKFDLGGPERAFLQHPDTSLVTWRSEDAAVHRGATFLFADHFYERFGDEGVRSLMTQPLDGVAGFDAVLSDLEAQGTFEDLFADWAVNNYLEGEPGYGYTSMDVEPPAPAAIYRSYPVSVAMSVQQFGTDYILLQGDDDLHIRFTGATATPLLNLLPHSGRYFWWSNRADESLTTLTRSFDLSGVEQATLTYWMWHDIEQGYDYASLEISLDGGKQWRALATPSGVETDPYTGNPEWAYTGQSDTPLGWIQEQVDLSPYTGGEVLVRFAYLTDEVITGDGFVIDDIAIPEIGYADDVEAGAGEWQTAGFVRANHLTPQRYLALLIGIGDAITVERLPVGQDQAAEWMAPLDSRDWSEAVILISGLSPLTTHPALYELAIE